ncbi:hypothetical protein [Enterococcus sp. AZ196]|uniref:hypothetical protein n=1 Tax=Enterococcus sp. AZ196 TaxID=2774659 RepID=UPI003D292EAA
MKKFRVIMVLAVALVFFTGCKKQTQKEFSEELAKQGDMNAGEYSAVIDRVAIEGEDADKQTRTSIYKIEKMISGTKMSGNYQIDFKKKLLAMDLSIDGLGEKFPIELYVDGKRPSLYISTDFIPELVNTIKAFNPDVPVEAKQFDDLKGKYLFDDQKKSKEKGDAKTDADTLSGTLNSQLFSDYLNTLDPDSFEKQEDTIKRTFTKKDVQNFVKYAKENGDKEEKKDAEKLEKKLKDVTGYKQTITLNTKKHTQKSVMKLAVKNKDMTVKLDMTVNNQAKKSDRKIKLPKAADTVSMEEFQKIIEDAQKSSTMISEEDFNDLLEVIRRNGSQLSQQQIEQFKSTYKPYLSEEQYKQLEEALEQAGQMAT